MIAALYVALFVSPLHAESSDRLLKLAEKCEAATAPDDLKRCVTDLLAYSASATEEMDKLLKGAEFCASQTLFIVMKACLLSLTGKPPAAAATAPPPPPEPEKRTWEKIETASRMDGSPSVGLLLVSDDEISTGIGTMTRPYLYLRCRENVTSVHIGANWFLDDNVPVTFRLDKEKPVSQSWSASTDRKAAGLWDGSRAIPFIKSLLGRETLLVRVTPFREGPKEMAFNITGAEAAIEPLRKACRW